MAVLTAPVRLPYHFRIPLVVRTWKTVRLEKLISLCDELPTVTGKIESIYFQVLEANPDFVPNAVPEIEVPNTSNLQKRVVGPPPSFPPNPFPQLTPSPLPPTQDVDCNIFADIPAYADGIVDQINYLYRLGGNCGITPSCTRVSCSYDNSVYACSRTGGNTAPECARLADGASAILGRCTRNGKVWGNDAEVRDYHHLLLPPFGVFFFFFFFGRPSVDFDADCF